MFLSFCYIECNLFAVFINILFDNWRRFCRPSVIYVPVKCPQGGGIWSPERTLVWGIWTAFWPGQGGIWTIIFNKFECPGGCPGGDVEALIWLIHKFVENSKPPYIFETIFGLFCLDIEKKYSCYHHVTQNRQISWPNDILYKFWNIFMQKYALLIFFGGILWVSWDGIFFFWKLNFYPFQWNVALYGTANNNRVKNCQKSCIVKNSF